MQKMKTILIPLTIAVVSLNCLYAHADTQHQPMPRSMVTTSAGKQAATYTLSSSLASQAENKGYYTYEDKRGSTTRYVTHFSPQTRVGTGTNEGDGVKFTVKLDYDSTKFDWEGMGHVNVVKDRSLLMVEFGSVYNEATGKLIYDRTATGTLPEGIYDFSTVFYDLTNGDDIFLVAEKVEIKEGAEVVFRPTDAVNRITMQPLLPNGDKVKLPLVKEGDDGKIEALEPGNVDFLTLNASFTFGDQLGGYSFYIPAEGRLEGAPEFASVTWRFNNVSDNYTATLLTVATIIDGDNVKEYYSHIIPEHLVTGTYQTDVNNYTDINWSGVKSNLAQFDALGKRSCEMIRFTEFACGRQLGGFITGWYDYKFTERLFAPSPNASLERVTVAYEPYIHEYTADNSPEPEVYHEYVARGTYGQPIFVENGEKISRSVRTNDYSSYFFTDEHYGQNEVKWFPTHERFDYCPSATDIILGNTVPIFTTLGLIWHTDWENFANVCHPVGTLSTGRLGEQNEGYLHNTDYKVTYNGEQVAEGKNYYNSFLGPWWYGGTHAPGVYDYEFSQDYILVDGNTASNKCSLHIDETTGDCDAPTLQHLMTRNADDFITDRFKTAQGAFIEFAGGDFNTYENDRCNLYHYEKAAAVKAEWTPHGCDDWHELAVTEVADGFKWGWGDLYRARLDGVTLPSESKWYDLRLTMVDKAGNTQRQTLSPAFRIQNVSGIEAVKGEASTVIGVDGAIINISTGRVEVYSLDGRKVADTDAQRIAMAPGIYIVKSATQSAKVMVK